MSAILFDLDGVLYEGDKAINGAAEAVDWFITNHIPHLFLTNTTSKPRSALVEKLCAYKIKTDKDDYLTPPVAAVQLLKKNNLNNISLFVPEVTKTEFSEFNLCDSDADTVDAVVIGDLAKNWSFEKMNSAFRLLMRNPDCTLIALGLTRYWRTDDGLQLDAGPFVKALEYASGRDVIITGKPAGEFYQAARDKLKHTAELVMIGDDIKGDIEAAQNAGIKAIQVRTGKFTEIDLTYGITPDAILDSIADLPSWWQQHMVSQ